jgi:hypothetical protein
MRRLGWNRESVDRLFRLDHASRLDQIEAPLIPYLANIFQSSGRNIERLSSRFALITGGEANVPQRLSIPQRLSSCAAGGFRGSKLRLFHRHFFALRVW